MTYQPTPIFRRELERRVAHRVQAAQRINPAYFETDKGSRQFAEDIMVDVFGALEAEAQEGFALAPQIGLTRVIYNRRVNHAIRTICEAHDITWPDMKGPSRRRAIAYPRQELMRVMFDDMGISYNRIGQLLGGRDHSTIIHGVKKARERREVVA